MAKIIPVDVSEHAIDIFRDLTRPGLESLDRAVSLRDVDINGIQSPPAKKPHQIAVPFERSRIPMTSTSTLRSPPLAMPRADSCSRTRLSRMRVTSYSSATSVTSGGSVCWLSETSTRPIF